MRLALGALLAALLAACGPTGPRGALSYATAMAGCGPVDQPATVIAFNSAPLLPGQQQFAPLRVTILQPVDSLSGRSWQVGAQASAVYITGGDVYTAATAGTVVVTSVDSARRVQGTIDLQFPGGDRPIATAFNAPWIQSGALCG